MFLGFSRFSICVHDEFCCVWADSFCYICGIEIGCFIIGSELMKKNACLVVFRRVVVVAALVVAGIAANSCALKSGGAKTNYVVTPVTDTITILLPDCEDEFCQIKIYGNNAFFLASDYVVNGCVKFCVSTVPAGRHRVFIHAGSLVADESFVKR